MKVFVSVDLEGVSGVVHWDQALPGGPDYGRSRLLQTAEADAVVAGAFEGGAAEVVVNDAHASMRNIEPQRLDARARLVQGAPKPGGMMEGCTPACAAALLVAYHAAAGEAGVLSHTYTRFVARVRVNGRPCGETALNALYAGAMGVPVAMVSGDDRVCAEARAWMPGIVTVEVKRALGRYAADSLAPAAACRLLRQGAADAVRAAAGGRLTALHSEAPVRIEASFVDPGLCDAAALVPGSQRLDATTVGMTAPDYPAAFGFLRVWFALAR